MTCEKVLDLMCYMVLPIQDGGKSQEEPSKVKPKCRKGTACSEVLLFVHRVSAEFEGLC